MVNPGYQVTKRFLDHALQTLQWETLFLAFLIYFERLEKQISQAAFFVTSHITCQCHIHSPSQQPKLRNQMFQVNENQPSPGFFNGFREIRKSTYGVHPDMSLSTPFNAVATPLIKSCLVVQESSINK